MPVGSSNGDFFESEMDAIMKRYPELKSPGTQVPKFENNAPAASPRAPGGTLKGNLSDMDLMLPSGEYIPRYVPGKRSQAAPSLTEMGSAQTERIWNERNQPGHPSFKYPYEPTTKEELDTQLKDLGEGVFRKDSPMMKDYLKNLPSDYDAYEMNNEFFKENLNEDQKKWHDEHGRLIYIKRRPLVSQIDKELQQFAMDVTRQRPTLEAVPRGSEPGGAWTKERVDQVKELAGKGLTPMEIGKELGITKGSVIGKMYREGIPIESGRSFGGSGYGPPAVTPTNPESPRNTPTLPKLKFMEGPGPEGPQSMSDEQPEPSVAGQKYASLINPRPNIAGDPLTAEINNQAAGITRGAAIPGVGRAPSITETGVGRYREGIAHLDTPTAAPTPERPLSRAPPEQGSIERQGLNTFRRERSRDTETGQFGPDVYPTTTTRQADIDAAVRLLQQARQEGRFVQEPYTPGRDPLPAGVERIGTAYRYNPQAGPMTELPVGKIKLEAHEDFSPNRSTTFNFIDETGKYVGYVRVRPEDEGKHLHIGMIASNRINENVGEGGWHGAFSFGADKIRDIFAELKRIYPDATTIGGQRVSGARSEDPKYVIRSLEPPYGKAQAKRHYKNFTFD